MECMLIPLDISLEGFYKLEIYLVFCVKYDTIGTDFIKGESYDNIRD